jgi:hypothetical protein
MPDPNLTIRAFDGARQSLDADVLFTVRDGNQREAFRDYCRGSAALSLPIQGGLADRCSVIAWAEGYEQAGFFPVNIQTPQTVDLMLLRKGASFNFAGTWDAIQRRENLARLITKETYDRIRESYPALLACLLNITTAMEQIRIRLGSPLTYFREICAETAAQDRFFGYAATSLVADVRQSKCFVPVSGALHPGATSSFKQIQFGEANVQITFHERDGKTIRGLDCCKVEVDIDYFKDLGAHALLEVLPNHLTGSLTDPRQVFVLRWIAGRRAGVEFDPLYVLA